MAERVFVDTNPIIYLLDDIVPFKDVVRDFLLSRKMQGAEFYTSTVTDAEFFVKPFENRDLEKINIYRNFLHDFEFLKCFVNEQIDERQAAEMRHRSKCRVSWGFISESCRGFHKVS